MIRCIQFRKYCNCAVCGAEKVSYKCGCCKSTFYCSKECQKKHWNGGVHKEQCVAPEVRAFQLYNKVAKQGFTQAQYYLGVMYNLGIGVEQSYKKAHKWYEKAAEQGHANAQYNMGSMYYFGQHILQDYSEAVKWYEKAAEQGHADAQYNLGVMYHYGEGVDVNYKKAFEWF